MKINKIFTCALLSLLTLSYASNVHANNIAVSNTSLVGQNTTAGVNNAANYSMVKFNVSWDNSWRITNGPANWDAAWVFVKFRVGASNPTFTGVSSSGTTVTVSSTANLRVGMPLRVTSGTGAFAANTVISSIINATQFVVSATPTTQLSGAGIECIRIWEHARLNNTGHTAPSGSTIDAGLLTPGSAFNATTNPALGVFIYRDAVGIGTNTFNNTQLRWNYGANGINDNTVISIQVFAIEMVHVPGGVDFNVGGGGGTSAFTTTTINTATATTVPSGTGSMGGQAGGYPTGQTAPANATWPNGYNAFYCMKYEISQGQYRDFLNTLTRTQQANRVNMDGTVGRYAGGFTWNGSAWSGGEINNLSSPANRIGLRLVADPGGISPSTYACDLNPSATLPTGVNQYDDGEWIAMGQLNWMDGCAYMDWAGLRPMTELEYEKACRGNQAAVIGEYAWGNATTTSANNITNGMQAGEVTNTANANSVSANQTNVQGPLRVGVFAGAATTREQAGATYYGIMEMSGNLWERAVTIGNTEGRAYTGTHGDGSLSANGHANSTSWPGLVSTEVTGALGSGFRGGVWSNGISNMRLSDRAFATFASTNRYSSNGFRGIRVSP
jgi:formylglycine-generating enzyme required for sulfatase activity